jgi:hypothetical protein
MRAPQGIQQSQRISEVSEQGGDGLVSACHDLVILLS